MALHIYKFTRIIKVIRSNKLNLSDNNIFHIFSFILHAVLSVVRINGVVIDQLQDNDSFRCIIIYVEKMNLKTYFATTV